MEDDLKRTFDATAPFIVEIISGGIRRAVLNYPTDKQWIARSAASKTVRLDIGRGKSRSDRTPIEDFDKGLFTQQLAETPEVEFDEFEATLVIERLMKADVIDSEIIGGDTARVSMEVFGGAIVEHMIRMPRRRQVVEYGRAAVHHTSTQKGGETTISLEPTQKLFDDLVVSSTGYKEGTRIPIIHKDVALVEVLRLQNPEA